MEYRRRTLNTVFDEENPSSGENIRNMSIEEHNCYQYEGQFQFWRVIGNGLYYSCVSCFRYFTESL
jgi:hypothetical protein